MFLKSEERNLLLLIYPNKVLKHQVKLHLWNEYNIVEIYIWIALSEKSFIRGGFLVPQVVVVINSNTMFEVIWEWNIVLELSHIGLT